jgi:hypothetical protein
MKGRLCVGRFSAAAEQTHWSEKPFLLPPTHPPFDVDVARAKAKIFFFFFF